MINNTSNFWLVDSLSRFFHLMLFNDNTSKSNKVIGGETALVDSIEEKEIFDEVQTILNLNIKLKGTLIKQNILSKEDINYIKEILECDVNNTYTTHIHKGFLVIQLLEKK